MNNTKLILAAFFGLLAGSFVGYFVGRQTTKDFYEQLAEEEIESVKKSFEKYRQMIKEEKSPTNTDDATDDAKTEVNFTQKTKYVVTNNNPLVRPSLERNPVERAKREYHLCATRNKENIPLDEENVETEDEETLPEEDDELAVTGEEVVATHPSINGVYCISSDEYEYDCPDYDKLSLYYYVVDDVLCDDKDEIIDDIEDYICYEALDMLSMQTTVWVRNEKLRTDFEVISINKSYAEANFKIKNENLTPRERYMRQKQWREKDET